VETTVLGWIQKGEIGHTFDVCPLLRTFGPRLRRCAAWFGGGIGPLRGPRRRRRRSARTYTRRQRDTSPARRGGVGAVYRIGARGSLSAHDPTPASERTT